MGQGVVTWGDTGKGLLEMQTGRGAQGTDLSAPKIAVELTDHLGHFVPCVI